MLDIVLYILSGILLLCCFFFTWTTVGLFWSKIPSLPSKKQHIQTMIHLAQLQKGERVYDLGCGIGSILFSIKQKNIHATGYEIIPPIYWIAQLRNFLKRSPILLKRENFFNADLSDANILFCYLSPSLMKKFSSQIWPTLKPGVRVVSHAFSIPNQNPQQIIQEKNSNIFLYIKK